MDAKYTVCLQGNLIETTVTCKASVVSEWINDVKSTAHLHQNIFGIDHIHKDGKTIMLQLCIGTKCLLVQCLPSDNKNDSIDPGRRFIHDPSLIFAGVDLQNKFSLSCRPSNFVDVQALAVARWCWPMNNNDPFDIISALHNRWKPGLEVLAKSIVDLNMERPGRVMYSNWESEELSWEQIEYACFEVYASFRIGKELLKHGNTNSMPNMMKSAHEDDDE